MIYEVFNLVKTTIYNPDVYCSSCFFRTGPATDKKKALIQMTERCNLHCEHCFVSATGQGNDIAFDKIISKVLPQFLNANINKVTITGGEPLVYPHLVEVVEAMVDREISVGICSNATLITKELCERLSSIGNVHFNTSLDGFSEFSHGRFRGAVDKGVFERTINGIHLLSQYDLLQGILVTPNIYTPIDEYVEICRFAKSVNAKYVLFNPLSEFGRGEINTELAYKDELMSELKQRTLLLMDSDLEIVYIRFPNTEKMPLGKCVAGDITYVFTNGDVAICPYMAFSSKDKKSRYDYGDFIIGNIFDKSFCYNDSIKSYSYPDDVKDVCSGCEFEGCLKGCFAIKISKGLALNDTDIALCPINQHNWESYGK